MKIAFFIGTLNTGGAEKQFSQLAQGLALKNYEIMMITLYPEGQYWDLFKQVQNIKLISLFEKKSNSKIGTAFQLVSAPKILKTYLIKHNIDVIYSALEWSNLIAYLATKHIPQIKLIWGIRSSNMENTWQMSIAFNLCKLFSSSVPLAIYNSYAGLKYHQDQGYQCKKNIVIPNGIDTEKFKPNLEAREKIRQEWGVKNSEILIGLVGRLTPMKDHPTFLKAVYLLKKKQQNLRFVCVGDGDFNYKEKLKQMSTELGLAPILIWAGERKDMPDVYNGLDIVVSSSSYGEGFPNVIGEAMACGVPCVVTDVGDSALIVEDTGIVIAPKNPDALLKACKYFFTTKPKEISIITRTRILNNFSVYTLVEATEKELRMICVKPSGK